jgi:hypothetical protein
VDNVRNLCASRNVSPGVVISATFASVDVVEQVIVDLGPDTLVIVDEFTVILERRSRQEMAFYRLLPQHVFEDSLHVGYPAIVCDRNCDVISDEERVDETKDEEKVPMRRLGI